MAIHQHRLDSDPARLFQPLPDAPRRRETTHDEPAPQAATAAVLPPAGAGQSPQAAAALAQYAEPPNGRYYENTDTRSARNPLAGVIDVPRSEGAFEQQFTTLGLPSTDRSWALQDRVDGGTLRVVHNLSFLERVPEHLRDGIDLARYRQLLDPGSGVPEAERARLTGEVNAAVRRLDDNPEVRQTFGNMDRRQFTDYQLGILNQYIGLAANAGADASFILDLMPTELEQRDLLDLSPENFAVGDYILNTRQSSVDLAEASRAQGRQTFGLAVPYSNTAENILYRGGIPQDGVNNLSSYVRAVEGANPAVTTIASGFSQGATAVLEYARQHGRSEGLDYALGLAPMGGANGQGGTGVWAGELGATRRQEGVPTLSIAHEQDPARRIYPTWYPGQVISGALRFSNAEREQADLHSGMHHVDGVPQPQLGTKGYPLSAALPLMQSLVSGGELGQGRYRRHSSWERQIPDFNNGRADTPSHEAQ